MLEPRLTPERISVGGLSFITSAIAIITQSVGVPVTAKRFSADLAQAQRQRERQRMRGAGLFGFGRHHPDIVGQRAGDLLGDDQARRMDAVVIGDENAHRAIYIFAVIADVHQNLHRTVFSC